MASAAACLLILVRRMWRRIASARSLQTLKWCPVYSTRPLRAIDYAVMRKQAKSTVSEAEFVAALDQIEREGTQEVLVAHESQAALAACTLLVEPKFLRGGSRVAHLEALFPALPGEPSSAGEGATAAHAALVSEALSRARAVGCYKLLFDSSSSAESALMLRLGLKRSQLTMSQPLEAASPANAAAPMLSSPTFPTLGDGALALLRLRPLANSDTAAYIGLLTQVGAPWVLRRARCAAASRDMPGQQPSKSASPV